MTSIFVLDTETTGLNGINGGDKVLEIGIARVDLDTHTVHPEFNRIIHYDEVPEDCWAYYNTTLKPEDNYNSPWDIFDVSRALLYYEKYIFTAYNVNFDFGDFLHYPPWYFMPRLAPCIMEEAARVLAPDGRWLKAQEAYDRLCPDNPAALPEGKEQHRALSDAVCEGHILLALMDRYPEINETYMEYVETHE